MNVHGFGERGDEEGRDNGERGATAGESMAMACGERIRLSTLGVPQYAVLCCCPCCLGPLCSANRRTHYLNVAKTLSALLLLACLVLFVVELALGGVRPMSENPMVGPSSYDLALLGSGYGWRLQAKHELYRLVAPMFLHGGLFHILGNMMFLVLLGVPLEQKWGWRVFGLVFFVSGIGASLFSTTVRPNTISVGASGALFGLMGASLADLLTHWARIDQTSRRQQLLQQLMIIIIYMAVSFGSKYIDGWAHLGGLLYGLALGFAVWGPEAEGRLGKLSRPAAAGLLLTATGLLAGLFFGGVVATKQLFEAMDY